MRRDTPVHGEVIEAGAAAGLIGGVAMALFATTWSAAAGRGFWTPVEAIAATTFHSAVLVHGAREIVIGIAFHLVVSVFFGIAFAFLTPAAVAPAPALAFGLGAGVATLVVMALLVVPLVDPVTRVSLMWGSAPGALPVYAAFAMHLLYGAGLSLAPAFRRRIRASARAGARGARA